MAESERKPWEQMPGEPPEAYARFLVYRNLGPARSLDAAYQSTLPATKRRKSLRASGQWMDDSAAWAWGERTTAWDIDMLTEHGRDTVIAFIAALERLALKTLAALDMDRIKPTDWAAVVNAIRVLGSFIPGETVAAIRATAERGDTPAIGASAPQHDGDGLG